MTVQRLVGGHGPLDDVVEVDQPEVPAGVLVGQQVLVGDRPVRGRVGDRIGRIVERLDVEGGLAPGLGEPPMEVDHVEPPREALEAGGDRPRVAHGDDHRSPGGRHPAGQVEGERVLPHDRAQPRIDPAEPVRERRAAPRHPLDQPSPTVVVREDAGLEVEIQALDPAEQVGLPGGREPGAARHREVVVDVAETHPPVERLVQVAGAGRLGQHVAHHGRAAARHSGDEDNIVRAAHGRSSWSNTPNAGLARSSLKRKPKLRCGSAEPASGSRHANQKNGPA